MTDDTQTYDPRRVLLIHASAISVNGRALVFLGPPGTGKSTICSLLSSIAQPLADDGVYLLPQTVNQWVVGDARAGVGVLSEQEMILRKGTVLQAVFRLHRAPWPHLEHITDLETCRLLTDALFETRYYQHQTQEVKRQAFAHAAAIARFVPGYHFHFDLSLRTSQTLLAAISQQLQPN